MENISWKGGESFIPRIMLFMVLSGMFEKLEGGGDFCIKHYFLQKNACSQISVSGENREGI